MDIVNNRYRIIKSLKQNNAVSTYLATDLWDEYQELELNILNSEFIPPALIDFYSNEFVSIKNIGSDSVKKNYGFNTLSYLDNKPTKEDQFFYTSEYVSNYLPLDEYSQSLNSSESIDVFVDLCMAINYLHLKGFIYGALNLRNIMIVKKYESSNPKILLRDIASVELDRYDHKAHALLDSYFTSPRVASGEDFSKESDMYSLGILLFMLLRKHIPSGNLNNELAMFKYDIAILKKENENEGILLEKILPFIEKLTSTSKVHPYEHLQDFIHEFNHVLGKSYSIVSRKDLEKLHFHTKLVAREESCSRILEHHRNMNNFKPFQKIFLVKGDTGTGKTRFLEEVKFLLELEKANVYSSFSLKSTDKNSQKMWVDILRKLIMESPRDVIEKYESELLKYFPELIDNKSTPSPTNIQENTKYRLLNRIAGFINDSIKNKPAVIIIDDIHLADDFTIDTLTYLSTEVIKNNNIIIIMSINEGTEIQPLVSEFLNQIKLRNDSSTLYMNPLDVEQSGLLIKHILAMPHKPMKLAETIYSKSYGNPLFICETIKDLYIRKIIFVNDETGRWSIDLPDENAYELLSVPSNIEQALLNQIKDLSSLLYEILLVMSIFTKPLSTKTITHFTDISEENLGTSIDELVNKGIVTRFIYDSGYLYDFNNQILKNIVYSKMGDDERRERHRLAALHLEKEIVTDTLSFDELIFHFERADMKEAAKDYSIKNAQRMKELKNSRGEIKNLEKALSLVDQDTHEKIRLTIELGILYSDTGDTMHALDLFNSAEKLIANDERNKDLIDIYINIANIYSLMYDNESAEEYLKKVEGLLNGFEYREAELEVKRIKALMLVDDSSLDKAGELFQELLEECGDGFHKIKGNTYRHLGYIYSYINRDAEALELYHKSIEVLEKINYTRGILLALNNIGSIYNDSYNNQETALEYYIKVLHLSEEYGISGSEVFGLSNIAAIHWKRYDLPTANEHFKEALKKAIRNSFIEPIFFLYNGLAILNREMGLYSTAFDYYFMVQKEFEQNPNRGMDVLDYYVTQSNINYSFGRIQEAINWEQKLIEFHKDREHLTKSESIIRQSIYQLHFKEMGTYNELIKEIIERIQGLTNSPFDFKINMLCEASLILSNKLDYDAAKLFLKEAEKEIKENTPDQLKAKFYYAKGSSEDSEQCITILLKALEHARKAKCRDITSFILMKLGDYYFTNEDYYNAANHYIDSCEILKNLIHQIPDDFKLTYVNSFNLSRGFYRLQYIKNSFIGKMTSTIIKSITSFEVSSVNDLKELLNAVQLNDFKDNKDFMLYISNQYMEQLSKDTLSINDIITNLRNDTIKDIEMVLKYLAATTLSTRGIVAISGNQASLKSIASTDENYALPSNQFIFDRARSSLEPVLLSNRLNPIQKDADSSFEDIRSCLCIPITTHHLQLTPDDDGKPYNGKNKNIGYLYLESDRPLNNINEDGLKKCLDVRNFLAMLLEKHQLKLSASVDKLTGALTRKYLEDALHDTLETAANQGEIFSIIMYDLDRFKRINDKFGHQTGDEVLRKVSKTVMDHLRRKDVLGRYGGEEFTIILPGADINQASSIAEEIRREIEQERILGNQADITISMGISTYPDHGQSIKELISKADQALYVAKENGRNRCQKWVNTFVDKIQPTNKLTGIISGNEIQDSRNILALVELIQLMNKSASTENKIHHFLGRIIEVCEAQYGFLLFIEDGRVGKFLGRKTQNEDWVHNINFNTKTIQSVIQEKHGAFLIDWDDTDKHNPLTGLPDWHSILAVPVLIENEVKGVIYLSVSTRLKEFGLNELNIVNIFSDLAASIIK